MGTISSCFEAGIFIHYQQVVKGLLKDDIFSIHFQLEEIGSFSASFLNCFVRTKQFRKVYSKDFLSSHWESLLKVDLSAALSYFAGSE